MDTATNGGVGEERRAWFTQRLEARARLEDGLAQETTPSEMARAGLAVRADGARRSLMEWLRFPEVTLAGLAPWLADAMPDDALLVEEVEEDAAYAPYLARQEAELRDLRANETVPLGEDFPYDRVPGLSAEMVERLSAARPETLAAAGRLAGITPAALASLLVHARRRMVAA